MLVSVNFYDAWNDSHCFTSSFLFRFALHILCDHFKFSILNSHWKTNEFLLFFFTIFEFVFVFSFFYFSPSISIQTWKNTDSDSWILIWCKNMRIVNLLGTCKAFISRLVMMKIYVVVRFNSRCQLLIVFE